MFSFRQSDQYSTKRIIFKYIVALYLFFTNILIAQIHWEWQSPLPQGNTLHDIYAFDKNNIIAIGNNNTIIKTTDGGQTWEFKENGLSVYDRSSSLKSLFFVDDNTGWIIGRYGLILHTTDGGETWCRQTSPSTLTLRSVFFLNHQIGWITTVGGSLLHTTDGGNEWHLRNLEGWTSYLENIQFIDDCTGWLLAYSNTEQKSHILMTQDGGETWQDIYTTDTVDAFYHLQFINSEIGWVRGYVSFEHSAQEFCILKTSDGGHSWAKQYSNGSASLTDLYALSDQEVWVIGEIGPFIKTTDGGETWNITLETSDDIMYTNSVHFSDSLHGWVAGAFGAIYKTADGGKNWQLLRQGPKSLLESVYFTSPQTGWAAGWSGTVLNTVDGGITWQEQDSGTREFLTSIMFVDVLEGWAVGGRGEIIHTENGGKTWTNQYGEALDHLESVFFIDDSTGWATGFDNNLNAIVMSTIDGGINWEQKRIGSNNVFWEIHFESKKIGWVSGYSFTESRGIVLKTTDGGATWQDQVCNAESHLESICFVDSLTGWAVGGHGVIIKTIDGGEHWVRQECPTPGVSWFNSVWFINTNEGWAVGEEIAVKTTDGGEHWDLVEIPRTTPLMDVYFTGSSSVWVVGGTGSIIRLYENDINGIRDVETKYSPEQFYLLCNYPNPFNPSTTISFDLPNVEHVKLEVYDITGRMVTTLLDNNVGAGSHRIIWYGLNSNGLQVPSGLYFCRITAGAFNKTIKMTLLK